MVEPATKKRHQNNKSTASARNIYAKLSHAQPRQTPDTSSAAPRPREDIIPPNYPPLEALPPLQPQVAKSNSLPSPSPSLAGHSLATAEAQSGLLDVMEEDGLDTEYEVPNLVEVSDDESDGDDDMNSEFIFALQPGDEAKDDVEMR